MRAVIVDAAAGSLRLEEVPEPEPSPTDVLVRVRAAGLNRADLLARAGTYKTGQAAEPPPPAVGGLELAGDVVATGSDVSDVAVGDRVMAMGAGYAERACVSRDLIMPVPQSYSWVEAGATPVCLLTVHDALVTNGRAAAGDAVLIQGVTCGVGSAALALARSLGAKPILGTTRSAAKLDRLSGELIGIDATQTDAAEITSAATGGHGADVVIDNVGASALSANIAASAIGGRIVQVGRLGGRLDEIDLDEVARKRLSLIGVTFRTRTPAERAAVVSACLAGVGEALADGALRPIVGQTFPLEQAEEAQEAMARDEHVGKLVLTVD